MFKSLWGSGEACTVVRIKGGEANFLTKTAASFDLLQGELRFKVYCIHQVHAVDNNLLAGPKPSLASYPVHRERQMSIFTKRCKQNRKGILTSA